MVNRARIYAKNDSFMCALCFLAYCCHDMCAHKRLDGTVCARADLIIMTHSPPMQSLPPSLHPSEYRDAFGLFDKRGDGKIDSNQIGDVLRALNLNPTELDVKKVVAEVDPSGEWERGRWPSGEWERGRWPSGEWERGRWPSGEWGRVSGEVDRLVSGRGGHLVSGGGDPSGEWERVSGGGGHLVSGGEGEWGSRGGDPSGEWGRVSEGGGHLVSGRG